MEALKRFRQIRGLIAGASLMAFVCAPAAFAAAQSPAEQLLLQKAQVLEQSGHIDLAAQSWKQILLSDPNNQQALAGLARWARISGDEAEAKKYIDRLKRVNPNNPAINTIQNLVSRKAQNQMLTRAADLARSGQNAEALAIYHKAFGDNPPDNWAKAYYDTEASMASTRPDAINGLRGLVKRYPDNSEYAIDLGRVLTYDAATRAEGERILQKYRTDGAAQAYLRQALQWDVQNPGSATMIREYLKSHPDSQLASELAQTEARQARESNGFARTPAERAAYLALSENHLKLAEQRFMALNAANPANPRVLAGLGFLRMKQSHFGGAISYFEQAQQNGLHSRIVAQSLATCRFWFTMRQGTSAMNGNRLDDAITDFRSALAMRPGNTNALGAMAGLYMKMQEPAAAIPYYEQLLHHQPGSEAAWKGIFMARAQAGDSAEAIALTRRFPLSVRRDVIHDPDYLRTLASAYSNLGQDAEARQVLANALRLPQMVTAGSMRSETRLQFAGLLAQDKQYSHAAAVYQVMIDDNPDNISAWQGLVSMQHLAGDDAGAIQSVERMPPDAYEEVLRNGNFLSMLAAIYQEQNHPDVAEGFLERAAQVYQANGQALPMSLQLQIASIDLNGNHAQGAYRIYRSVLSQHPGNLNAWKGLLSALHQTGHDADALAQIQEIPQTVREQLNRDIEYQQTIAGIYSSTGHPQAALGIISRIQAHYYAQHMAVPPAVEIQNAWLLFNTGDSRALYPELMALGDRTDLTDIQRRQVQTIWASWAQRRAAQEAKNGQLHRAIEVLTAAAQAFPGNPAVSKALAAGYAQAGQPKQALAIYKAMDLSDASANDYQSMIGAALGAQDMKTAELWLREALRKYPRDPKILSSAARFESARGDNVRAAAYWKASLNAMPVVSPTAELAHKLDHPDLVQQSRLSGVGGLVALLNPNGNPLGRGGAGAVALPGYRNPNPTPDMTASNQAYGPDPYYMGTAPVQLNRNQPVQNQITESNLGNPEPSRRVIRQRTTELPPPSTYLRKRRYERAPRKAPRSTSTWVVPGTEVRRKPRRTHVQTGVFKPEAELELPPPPTPGNGEVVVPVPGGESSGSGRQEEASNSWRPLRVPSWSDRSDGVTAAGSPGDSGGNVHLHLSITSASVMHPETQQPSTQIAQLQPQEITLSTSPVLTEIPSASDAAMKRAEDALRTANRPIDPSLFQAQYITPSNEIAQQTPPAQPRTVFQQPEYQQPPPQYQPTYERPPAVQDNSSPSYEDQSEPAAPSGATDNQLMQENLPPLRGPYRRTPILRMPDPRQEAERQLASIEGGYSPWLGGSGFVNHRSGTAGYDSLAALEAPFEASGMLGTAARVTIIATPTFLDAGVPTTSPVLNGGISEQLGTAPANAVLEQQNAYGVAGQVQIAAQNFGVSLGYTPYGFLVNNVTGSLNWKPANGPFTFTLTRDSVTDSQLSWSGLHDPGSAGPGFAGNIWGGVISTGGEVQFGRGGADSGYYVSGGGQHITGVHVETNDRVDGDAGAYWRVKAIPDEGNLTLGVNFFGMHYSHDLDYFTYGQGGYFSPQAYFLANVPVTWNGQYGDRVHYNVIGAFGVQAFQEDSSPYFPLDPAIQTANKNLSYPNLTSVGDNYDLSAHVAYHLSDHWYAGAALEMNNTRSYNDQQIGFFVRFLIRPQYAADKGATGLFPMHGLRPFLAP